MEICECGKVMQKYIRINSKQDLYACECGKTRLVDSTLQKKKHGIEPVLQDRPKYIIHLTGKAAIDDV
jgi:hypothetical protein